MRKIEDIHRLHDGELAGEKPALDEADQVRLRAIADIGAAVKNTLEAQSKGVDLWSGMAPKLVAADKQAVAATQKQAAARGWRAHTRGWGIGIGAALAAAAAALVLSMGRGATPTNNADIEELDVSGAAATVIRVPDKDKSSTTTVLWTNEE